MSSCEEKLKWLMSNIKPVRSGSDVYSSRVPSEQIITFPQMPRKLYSLQEIKAIAGSWGAVSNGNVSRSKAAIQLTNGEGLPAVGGWIFETAECLQIFLREHGGIDTTLNKEVYGPLAFEGWERCSWKARAFYIQLMSFGAIDHHRFTFADLSDRKTVEVIQVKRFVSRIERLLNEECNSEISNRVRYLDGNGNIAYVGSQILVDQARNGN